MAYRQMANFCRRAGLRQNPDFSGFASRRIWIPTFPGLAEGYLQESIGFPDLPMVISGKPSLSRTCRWLSPGNHRFTGLAVRRRVYSGYTLNSLQSAEKYFRLRPNRRDASARLPPVFFRVLSAIAFLQA